MIKKNSSPGLDGIEYGMIAELTEAGRSCLLKLYNIIWSSDVLPDN